MADLSEHMLETFVALADTLASDYEVSEFLRTLVERCAESLDVTTGGVMLETPRGTLQLAAALTAEMEALEQAEIDTQDGPCHQAYRTGERVVAEDLDDSDVAERWPRVYQQMRDLGLRAAFAFPLRLRDDRIGALNLYRDTPGELHPHHVRLGQAFADVAAIGILQARKVATAEERAAQLQYALDSRVVIEQAKGVVCAERGISVDDAFQAIRRHARSRSQKVRDVAEAVVDRGSDVLDHG